MEPSPETNTLVGQLCTTWARVEMLSERTLRCLLELTQDQTEAFVWRMQLPQRWQAIVRAGRKRVSEDDLEVLKSIKTMIDAVQRDRNIIVRCSPCKIVSASAGG